MAGVIGKLLDGPLIFIYIVAQTDLRVDIITKEVNVGLVLWASIERWELEQRLLY